MLINLEKIINEDQMKYFKQFDVYETLKFSNICIDRKIPIESSTKLKIISAKIVDTYEGTSVEGQCLTGKKLVLLGGLNRTLLIPYCNGNIDSHVERKCSYFSTFIIIPKDVSTNEQVNLRYFIEDTTAKAINSHSVLVSSSILLQFVDEYV